MLMRGQEDQGSAAENLAQSLLRLSAEDMSNVIFWLHIPELEINLRGPGMSKSVKACLAFSTGVTKSALIESGVVTSFRGQGFRVPNRKVQSPIPNFKGSGRSVVYTWG